MRKKPTPMETLREFYRGFADEFDRRRIDAIDLCVEVRDVAAAVRDVAAAVRDAAPPRLPEKFDLPDGRHPTLPGTEEEERVRRERTIAAIERARLVGCESCERWEDPVC